MTPSRPYVGYVDERDLPYQRGDRVVVPRGARVLSTHPVRRLWVTARRQIVTVDHIIPGVSHNISNMIGLERERYPGYEEWFALFDAIRNMRLKQNPGKLLDLLYVLENKFTMPISNPIMRWAGTGGYWNAVTFNALMGIPDDPVPPVWPALDDFIEAICYEQG